MSRLCLILALAAFCGQNETSAASNQWQGSFYDQAAQSKLKPYFLPKQHPMKPALDLIFAQARPLSNVAFFKQAGFEILLKKRAGHTRHAYWHLAKHPQVPGYLFKVYLDTSNLKKNEGWRKLANRCIGAANIRNLIKKKGLRHFVVPEKWLYRLPFDSDDPQSQQPVILMVTDMRLTCLSDCEEAWKDATKEQLDELYCIYSHGYGSTSLVNNVCYTREGKFAFIDTELPYREVNMKSVLKYFSEEMQDYWEDLIRPKKEKGL